MLANEWADVRVIEEIISFFSARIQWLGEHGVARERIIVDPGIGFGKTLEHNLEILKNVAAFKETGCPVLIGHSRKSFLEKLFGLEVDQRDCPSAVISSLCALQGADIIRVHDVSLTQQTLKLTRLLMG